MKVYPDRDWAMFAAAASSTSRFTPCVVVLRVKGGWSIRKAPSFAPEVSAIFFHDYLIWSVDPTDRVQNYFGHIPETAEAAIVEIEHA